MTQDKTIELISLALDAALLRQKTIATNIANINTSDYQVMEVNFEQQLRENAFQEIRPFLQRSQDHNSLDDQLALSVKNLSHYRALVKGLNQKLALIKLALEGNNSL